MPSPATDSLAALADLTCLGGRYLGDLVGATKVEFSGTTLHMSVTTYHTANEIATLYSVTRCFD